MKRLLIFDFDGLILDTEAPVYDAWQEIYGEHGCSLTFEKWAQCIGTADTFVPLEDIDALEAAGAQVVRYEGAEHGFVHDASRPAHRPDDASDAWRRAIEFIDG